MNILTPAANLALLASSLPGYRRWLNGTRSVSETQSSVLLSIVHRNAETDYGRKYRFSEICSVREFQQRVPLQTYADLAPYIERAAAGEPNVLTSGPVERFELSSGSTSASKLIPYNAALKTEFQAGLEPWLCSLYMAHPKVLTGKQYWSVTPVGQLSQRTAGGIPIGFDEDAEYFGPIKRKFIRNLMAVPSAVGLISDIEIFRYVTLRFLLQCRDLTFISVWNPTFLTLLLQTATARLGGLITDIANGTLSVPLDSSLRFRLGDLQSDPVRAEELKRIVGQSHDGKHWQAIWPKLSLISCWADASASRYAAQLRACFPGVPIQPKGLLATEGFISFPAACGAAALSIHSHFFEFAEVTEGSIKLAAELEPGRRYSVIMTTGGGLYRYQLDDLIEVTGFVGNLCPVFRFVGKAGLVVDLMGEKLNEAHVRELLKAELDRLQIDPMFSMIAPEEESSGNPVHYTFFVQFWGSQAGHSLISELTSRIEKGLLENYHYRYCRHLGQLGPLQAFVISSSSGNASDSYLTTCTRILGQRLGNVKPTALHGYRGWRAAFL